MCGNTLYDSCEDAEDANDEMDIENRHAPIETTVAWKGVGDGVNFKTRTLKTEGCGTQIRLPKTQVHKPTANLGHPRRDQGAGTKYQAIVLMVEVAASQVVVALRK
jgi:hypothetical protein